ncbi:alkyl sulfatase dimerization domain-containing protein [Nocardia sp. CA-136227]|uniref:alkyl sulfatase dimerization domain-containing protein n=1 Tax=Nocardia sp. CA-136227 TaxID=3239979 RepID=UPI003D98646E
MNQHLAQQVDELIKQRPGKSLLEPEYTDKAVAINDFLYMSGGTSAVYMIVTPAGRVIVNAGCGFEAPHHRKLFDDIYSGPTRYIITTQGHTDHVGGVAGFREPGAVYVANALNPSVQRDDARVLPRMRQWSRVWFGWDLDTVRRFAQERPDVPNIQDEPTPDLMFDKRLDLTVGGMRIELHAGVGETVDGAMVWLPQHRIALISNLLGPLFGHFPNLNTIRGQRYRFAEPYLETIRTLRDLRPRMLITGRGAPIEGEELIDAVLERMYNAVDHIHRATLDGINAGKDVETLMREVTLPGHLFVGQGYGLVKWGVKTICETYLGWFEHRATTELYPVAREQTLADLVSLAGAEAVGDLARAHLADGRVPEATALAEAVIAHLPDDPAGTALLLDCHRALLADPVTAENFWESGWLKHRIGVLERQDSRTG